MHVILKESLCIWTETFELCQTHPWII